MRELLVTNKSYGLGTVPGTTNFNDPRGTVLSSGSLTVGVKYEVTDAGTSANFSAAGGPSSPTVGDTFVATGTSVTWGSPAAELTSIYGLQEGSIAIVTDRGLVLEQAPTSNIEDVRYVRFALGRGVDKAPIYSMDFDRRAPIRINYAAYSAPQKEVKFIGAETTSAPEGSFVIPSPLVPTGDDPYGYSATVVIEKTNVLLRQPRITRYYQVQITDAINNLGTDAAKKSAIIQALVSKINADNLGFVTAVAIGSTGSETGIKITNKNYGEKTTISLEGVIKASDICDVNFSTTITEPKAMKLGIGRPAEIKDMENRMFAQSGKTDGYHPARFNSWDEDSKVQTGDGYGYAVLTISAEDFLPNGIGELGKMTQHKPSLAIAIEGTLAGGVPTGSWTISNSSDVKTVLDALLPVVFGSGVFGSSTASESAKDIA